MIAPLLSSHRVASQLADPQRDPRQLTDLNPREVAWGLTLVTLWQLRWLIVLALAALPALMVGVLHISTADFQVWHDSVDILGQSDSGARASYMSASGGIPYFRLLLQAISVGLLPLLLLPLMASLGVLVALMVEDVLLSDLVSLVLAMIAGSLVLLTWAVVSRVSLLAGFLELVRGLLLLTIMTVLVWGIRSLVSSSGTILSADLHD
jgi:hypothetical protein